MRIYGVPRGYAQIKRKHEASPADQRVMELQNVLADREYCHRMYQLR